MYGIPLLYFFLKIKAFGGRVSHLGINENYGHSLKDSPGIILSNSNFRALILSLQNALCRRSPGKPESGP